MPKRIAYLGPMGTFTEEAAILYDSQGELESFPTVAAVALAVSSGMAQEGVVPIENNLEGSVTATLDLLIHEGKLFINRELVLPIEHCLPGQTGHPHRRHRRGLLPPSVLGAVAASSSRGAFREPGWSPL